MNRYFKNMAVLASITLLESIWATAFLSWILSFMPKISHLSALVFNEFRNILQPNWDLELYHFFIFTACLIQLVLVLYWRRHMEDLDLWIRLRAFLAADLIFVLLLIGIVFRCLLCPCYQADHMIFLTLIFICLLFKLFWVSRFKI